MQDPDVFLPPHSFDMRRDVNCTHRNEEGRTVHRSPRTSCMLFFAATSADVVPARGRHCPMPESYPFTRRPHLRTQRLLPQTPTITPPPPPPPGEILCYRPVLPFSVMRFGRYGPSTHKWDEKKSERSRTKLPLISSFLCSSLCYVDM